MLARLNKPRVAVLRATGVIKAVASGSKDVSMLKLSKPMKKAFKMRKVKAVALVVNSPGGSPVQSSLITKRLQALRKETGVPVYAFVEDVAASGGYFVACGADEIYADESSVVGSIGAISSHFGLDQWIARYDINYRELTAGKHKSLNHPFKPESEHGTKVVQGLLDGIHGNFKKVVMESRGDRLATDAPDLLEGSVWLADEAKKLGLIDGIGDMHTIMAEKLGEAPRFVEMNARDNPFAHMFGASADTAAATSWFAKMSGPADVAAASQDAVTGAISAMNDQAAWSAAGVTHR